MEKVIDLHVSFMERMVEEGETLRELEKEGIRILSGFTEQPALVWSYYPNFYVEAGSRIVVCGINPGRLGAGKTGILLLVFHALDHLMPEVGGIQHNDDKCLDPTLFRQLDNERVRKSSDRADDRRTFSVQITPLILRPASKKK
ncbi:hypothetical protein ABE021_15395 [Sporosarcina gallistercoris]|uniref:hypothetical protein n=1 Tax=Sporosarcina gallistercoris TaxID=2762245 RepID=UPI003D26B033